MKFEYSFSVNIAGLVVVTPVPQAVCEAEAVLHLQAQPSNFAMCQDSVS